MALLENIPLYFDSLPFSMLRIAPAVHRAFDPRFWHAAFLADVDRQPVGGERRVAPVYRKRFFFVDAESPDVLKPACGEETAEKTLEKPVAGIRGRVHEPPWA